MISVRLASAQPNNIATSCELFTKMMILQHQQLKSWLRVELTNVVTKKAVPEYPSSMMRSFDSLPMLSTRQQSRLILEMFGMDIAHYKTTQDITHDIKFNHNYDISSPFKPRGTQSKLHTI